MVYNKIKKLFAVALAASVGVTSLPGIDYSASATTIPVKETADKTSDKVSLADNTEISEDDEGVFKVTVDDNGNITAASDNEYAADENTPFSWDNVNIYFVITDRFKNGDTSNDHSYGRGLDKSGSPVSGYENKEGYFHGGDLAGMTQMIEEGYFDKLGTNAIWISAPYEQIHGALAAGGFKHYAYHGYYALDFTEVDANMGTAEDLEKFIDTAHEHGIRVVFDIVMNHAGYANPKDAAEFGYGKLASNWEDIYYGWSDNQYKWYNDYVAEASQNGSQGMMDAQNGDWETNWWGSKWVRMTKGRFTNYSNQAPEDSGVETCLDGLPDFVTEGTSDPGMPGILKKKWGSEKLAQEEKELDEFCKNYGMSKCVTTYITKWLTDWVREYGVDGFRCDTAKHVNQSEWGKLKKAGVQALKEWRENNPDKPGAQWKDDFWMTGEAWDHGVNKDGYYSTGGFDSMINFSYQGTENKSGAALEGTYSDYAQKINSDSSFNVLSYISSHDTALGARSANAGTALLLTPGGVQTYYGDESGRTGDGTSDKQPTRSNMNWSNMNQSILSNWQKVGRFRREHIAVGAGKHQKISDSPYTFSRTYTGKANVGSETKTDYTDKVVVSLPGTAGTHEIDVSSVFEDGTTLVDSYSETEYTVEGGKVSVTCDNNGVILLGEPNEPATPKAKVSASVTSGKVSDGTYSDDTITVKIATENMKDAKVTVDGYAPAETENADGSFEESISLTIGEATAYEETTTVKVTGISTIDDSEVTKEFKYTRSAEPKIGGVEAKGLYLRVKKSDFDKAPQVYIYSGTGDSAKEYTAAWPGDALKEDGDYYVYSNDTITNEVYVIVHSYIASKEETPAWRSSPDMKDPVPAKGCIELKKGASSGTFESFTMDNPDAVACKVTINYVTDKDDEIKSIYRVGEAGADFTAYAPAKMYHNEQEYVFAGEESKKTGTFTEEEQTITFTYSETGVVATVPPTATPTATPIVTPEVTPTVEPATPTPTATIEVTTTPTAKPATPTPTSKATPTVKPTATPVVTPVPTISVSTKPAITAPVVEQEAFDVTISSVPAEVQYAGANVKFTAIATGGSGNYTYQFAVKAANGTAVKTRAYKTTNTFTWKASKAGVYTIVVNAKDDTKGKTDTAEMTFVVKKGVSIKKFVVKAMKKLKYSLSATATGGSGKYKYKFTYTLKGKKKVLKGYSSAKSIVASLKKKGTYKFTVSIKDAKTGTVKSKTMTVKVKK